MFALCLALYGAALGRDALEAWVDRTALPSLVPDISTEVLDRNGDVLRIYTVGNGTWRLGVTPRSVDPDYLRMLVAYEDKRFYTHNGIDGIALVRAVGQAVRHGRIISGGSTLTMQVARLLEQSGTGAWRGKLRQMRVAMALETELGKDEILQLYLTLAPFGGNLEGIRAASLSFFGKEPRRLTKAQSALLVALPQSPEARRPDQSLTRAKQARLRVMSRLLDQGLVSEEEVRTAHLEPLSARRYPFARLAPHMSDRVRRANGSAPVHHLTIDAALQKQAERLAARTVHGTQDRVSVAMIVADHTTGEILAHVGSADYSAKARRQGFVDMTRAIRSPGSTLKPLVYALAFDLGLAHPATLIDDRPVAFGGYAPQNFDRRFRGELTVAEALQQSLNIPVVLLTDDIGPSRLTASMRAAGMAPKHSGAPGLAVALGGVGVTLEGLVTLYAGLAQNGSKQTLTWEKSRQAPKGHGFVSRSSAWHVGHILSGLAPPATAGKRRLAYKTGTSYGHRDAWAIGYDGRYVAGIWIGRADGTPVPGAFGGDLAAPVLFELMGLASPKSTPLGPPPPETLLLETENLPRPLQRFKGRSAVFQAAADAPKLAFPPDGARLIAAEHGLSAKLRDGEAPFTWLANGTPVATRSHAREITLPVTQSGFVQLSVIDAKGRTARATVRLD